MLRFVIAALLVQSAFGIMCRNATHLLSQCEISENSVCNDDGYFCRCANGMISNFYNVSKCIPFSTGSQITPAWTSQGIVSRVYRTGNQVSASPTFVECKTLVDPMLYFDDPCHKLDRCSQISSNPNCGWCVSQKRGLTKSNSLTLSNGVYVETRSSLDGSCYANNTNWFVEQPEWVVDPNLCPVEYTPTPIPNTYNNPICESIPTCQAVQSYKNICGWCTKFKKALNRTNNLISDDQSCFGENWIASDSNTDFVRRCPAMNTVSAKCTSPYICNNNGYQESFLNLQYHRTNGIINPSGTIPAAVSLTTFKPKCECVPPFTGPKCESIKLQCGNVTCSSFAEECNPSGQGCRCKNGFYPDINTRLCVGASTFTASSTDLTSGVTYEHRFEKNTPVQSSSVNPAIEFTYSGTQYYCYLPYNLNVYNPSISNSLPAFCRGGTLCNGNSNQYRWVLIDIFGAQEISRIQPLNNMECYCPLHRTGPDCVRDTLICGVRKKKSSNFNIVPQLCDSTTEQCNNNGDGCMCKPGFLPESVNYDINVNKCTEPPGVVTRQYSVVRGPYTYNFVCDISINDEVASFKKTRVGARCRSQLLCNNRGYQNVFLRFNSNMFMNDFSYITKSEYEPIMGCQCDAGWKGENCIEKVVVEPVVCLDPKQRVSEDGLRCECRPYYFPTGSNGDCVSGVSSFNPLATIPAPVPPQPTRYPLTQQPGYYSMSLNETTGQYEPVYSGPKNETVALNGIEPYASFYYSATNVMLTNCDAVYTTYKTYIEPPSEDRLSIPLVTIGAYCSTGNSVDPPSLGCSRRNGKRFYTITFRPYFIQMNWEFDKYETWQNTVSIYAYEALVITASGGCYCQDGYFGDKCQYSCVLNYASNTWDCLDVSDPSTVMYPQANTLFNYMTPSWYGPSTSYIPITTESNIYKFYPMCYSSSDYFPISCDSTRGLQCSSTGFGCECMPGWFPDATDGICTPSLSNGGYYENIYTDTDLTVSLSCWLQQVPDVRVPIRGLCNGPGICSNPSSISISSVYEGREFGSQFMQLEFDAFIPPGSSQVFWYATSQIALNDQCQCQGLRGGMQCQLQNCMRDYPTFQCRSDSIKTPCEVVDVNNFKRPPNRNLYCEPRRPMATFVVDAIHQSGLYRKRYKCFLSRKTPLQYQVEPLAVKIDQNTARAPYNLVNGNFLCDDITTSELSAVYQKCPAWYTSNPNHPSVSLNGTRVCPRVFVKLKGRNVATPDFEFQLLYTSGATRNGMFCPEGWYYSQETMSCANRCKQCASDGEYCDDFGECQCKIGWYRSGLGQPCVFIPNGCPPYKYGLGCSQDCSFCKTSFNAECDDGPGGTGGCRCPVLQFPNQTGCAVDIIQNKEIQSNAVVVKPGIVFSAGRAVQSGLMASCVASWQEPKPDGFGCQIRHGFLYNDFETVMEYKGVDLNRVLPGTQYADNPLALVNPTTRWYQVINIPGQPFMTFRCSTLFDPVLTNYWPKDGSGIMRKVRASCTSQWICNGLGSINLDVTFVPSGASRVIDGPELSLTSAFANTCNCPSGFIANDDRCDSRELVCGTKKCVAATEECNPNGIGCKCKPGYFPDLNTGRCQQPSYERSIFKSLVPRVPQIHFQLRPDTIKSNTYYKYTKVSMFYNVTGQAPILFRCYADANYRLFYNVAQPAYCQVSCMQGNTTLCTALRSQCQTSDSYRWYSVTVDSVRIKSASIVYTDGIPQGCDCPISKTGPNCQFDTVICGREYYNKASPSFGTAIVCDSSVNECNSNFYGCRCRFDINALPIYQNVTNGEFKTVCITAAQPTTLSITLTSWSGSIFTASCMMDNAVITRPTQYNNYYEVNDNLLQSGAKGNIYLIGARCSTPSNHEICNGHGSQHLYLVYNRINKGLSRYQYVQINADSPIMTCKCDPGWMGDDCSIPRSSSVYSPSNTCGPFQRYINGQCISFDSQENFIVYEDFITPKIGNNSDLRNVNFDYSNSLRCYSSLKVSDDAQISGVYQVTKFDNVQMSCDSDNTPKWYLTHCNGAGYTLYNVNAYKQTNADGMFWYPLFGAALTDATPLGECQCLPGFYGRQCEYTCSGSTCFMWKNGPLVSFVNYTSFDGVSFDGIPLCYAIEGGSQIECPAEKGLTCSGTGVGCVCMPGWFPRRTGNDTDCYHSTSVVYSDSVYIDTDRNVKWSCWLERDPATVPIGTTIAALCAGIGVCNEDTLFSTYKGYYRTRFFDLVFDVYTLNSKPVYYTTSIQRLPGQTECRCNNQASPVLSPECATRQLTSYPTIKAELYSATSDICLHRGIDFIQQINRNRYCVTRFPERKMNISATYTNTQTGESSTRSYSCFIPRYVPRNGEIDWNTPSVDRLVNQVTLLCDQISNCTSNGICRRGFHSFKGWNPQMDVFTVVEGALNQCPLGYYYRNTTDSCQPCPALELNTYCDNSGSLRCVMGYKRDPATNQCIPTVCPSNNYGPLCQYKCKPCDIVGAACDAGRTGSGECKCKDSSFELNPQQNQCVRQTCGSGVFKGCSGHGVCVNTTSNGQPAEFSYCVCTDHRYKGIYCHELKPTTESPSEDCYVSWKNHTTRAVSPAIINRYTPSDAVFGVASSTVYRVGSLSQAKWECHHRVDCDGFYIWPSGPFTYVMFLAYGGVGSPIPDVPSNAVIHMIDRFTNYKCSSYELDIPYYLNRYGTEIINFCMSKTPLVNQYSTCQIGDMTQWTILHWKTSGHIKRYNPNSGCLLQQQLSIWDQTWTPSRYACSLPRSNCGDMTGRVSSRDIYDVSICSDNGYCVAGDAIGVTGYCECKTRVVRGTVTPAWNGTYCQTNVTVPCFGSSCPCGFGQVRNSTTLQCEVYCRNGGTFSNGPSCTCNYGYTGTRCEIPPVQVLYCEPRGTGILGSCNCFAPWTGPNCEQHTCGPYGFVSLVRPGVYECNCFNGTKSSTFEKLDCSASICVRGQLYYSGGLPKCNCGNTKYNGTLCEDDVCGHGVAVGNICQCTGSVWNPATDCTTSLCYAANTLNYTNTKCNCKPGWIGDYCEVEVIIPPKPVSSSSSSSTGTHRPISSTAINNPISTHSSSTGPVVIITPPPISTPSSSSSSLTTGAIVGISVGGAAAASIIGSLVYISYARPATWAAIKFAIGL